MWLSSSVFLAMHYWVYMEYSLSRQNTIRQESSCVNSARSWQSFLTRRSIRHILHLLKCRRRLNVPLTVTTLCRCWMIIWKRSGVFCASRLRKSWASTPPTRLYGSASTLIEDSYKDTLGLKMQEADKLQLTKRKAGAVGCVQNCKDRLEKCLAN